MASSMLLAAGIAGALLLAPSPPVAATHLACTAGGAGQPVVAASVGANNYASFRMVPAAGDDRFALVLNGVRDVAFDPPVSFTMHGDWEATAVFFAFGLGTGALCISVWADVLGASVHGAWT